MATKKKEAAKAAAPAKGGKKAPAAPAQEVKKGKKEMTPEEKAAKKAARLEAIKNRPEGQRSNSRQVDVIDLGNGSVESFAYPVRKTGSLVVSVLKNAKGDVISVSNTFIPGVKAKSKKGHGVIVPGVAGEGKRKGNDTEDEDEDEGED